MNLSMFLILILLACLSVQMILLLKYKFITKHAKSLIACVSHDLKSPVYAQSNIISLLLKGQFGSLNQEQYEMLQLTQNSNRYMENLIGIVLTDVISDAKALKLNITKFDIVKLVNEICLENKINATDKKQNLIFNCNKDEIIVNADRLQIERVITNLLNNAITYGFKNSNIFIDLNQNDQYLNFSISNYSNPIPEHELKNIFNKFSKTNNSRYNKLTSGLGLYISKRIIELHGGTIYAKSTLDGICVFGFRLKTLMICQNIEKQ